MSNFLIIGGTGKVGGRLTRSLRAQGHQASAASRTAGDVRFDWHDPASQAPALQGADGVFLIGPGSATDWSGLVPPFLACAEASGVRRVILLSARAVEFLPDGAAGRAEEAVRHGPLAWTILRPSHFAQNFTEAMFVPVNDEVVAPVGHGAEPFVDAADIAEVAAAILTSEGYAGETIGISGPTAITFSQAVEILSEHVGRPLRFVSEDRLEYAARLRAAGTPEGYITWRMAMLDAIQRGADAYISDGVPRVLGRPATDFTTWAAREAGVLKGAAR
jgi:uncharacterized protein YbjT (DUF2867 family)